MKHEKKNLNELKQSSKIVTFGKKTAMLVPNLLAKLSVNLIVKPITKLVTGESYDAVREVAVDKTMQMQREEATEVKAEINQNLAELRNLTVETEEYPVGNLARCKSYLPTIERLSKRYNRLVSSPKRLLVAKNYLVAMQEFSLKRKQTKETAKLVQKVVKEYQARMAEMEAKKEEIRALEAALKESQEQLKTMNQEFETFEHENDNANIIEQFKAQQEGKVEEVPVQQEETLEAEVETPVAVEPVVEPVPEPKVEMPSFEEQNQDLLARMGLFARRTELPQTEPAALEANGLESEGPTKVK